MNKIKLKDCDTMLIIVGSRREGCSLKLAQLVKENLESSRINAKIIVPGNQLIHICTGCMDCDKTGVCDFNDDMVSNIELVKNENIIMFITPTRWNLLSGDIKIFLDRLNPLFSSKGLKGKKAIVVSIGSKAKDIYSSYSASTSLRYFIESAEMECVLTYDFNDCLNPSDLLMKDKEIDSLLENIKTVAEKN